MIFEENREKMRYDGFDLKETTAVVPKILLTDTTGWSAVALFAINLAKAGSDVSVVCPAHHPVLKARAVRQTFPYSGLRPLESLIAAIEASDPQLIIPCDERSVQHLHELHDRAHRLDALGGNLAALIEKSLGSPQNYAVVCARYEFLRIAREEGLRVPHTAPINTADDLKSWQGRQAFPCVLKADGTFGGRGVRIAHTPEQAAQAFRELSRSCGAARAIKRLCLNRETFWLRPWWKGVKQVISVQSYIHGRPANCAVVCWKGKVLAGMGVEVVSTGEPTGPASVVRVVDNPDMMLCAERIARRLVMSGFFGLDFIIEAGSGLTYLIEMNPRPIPLSRFQLGKGRDLVGAMCAQLSGQPCREAPPITQKTMIAYFPDAWNTKNEFLESSFQEVPEGEPDLVQEILRQQPARSFFRRLADRVEYRKSVWHDSDATKRLRSKA